MAVRKKTNNWWILVLPKGLGLDLFTGSLITNSLLPSDIIDEKKSIFSEYPVPGLDYSPFDHVRNDGTRISFSVPMLNQDKSIGNMLELAELEKVRSQPIDLSFTSVAQWKKNPVCIYSGWGTHRPPLPVVVEECKFSHKRDFTNRQGFSAFTEVSFSLKYIENSTMWKMYRKLQAVGGAIGSIQKLAR